MKTVYCLRLRDNDNQPWSEPEYFRTRNGRDKVARLSRCIGGFRTWSYQERVTPEQMTELTGWQPATPKP